jgi:LEA14-like dessication related protein
MKSKLHHHKIIIKSLLIFSLILLLSACAGLKPGKESVRVNLSNLKMLESTLFEQRFEAAIRIQNRTQSELRIKGLSYDLSLNDKDFASGVSNQTVNIQPLSEGVISIKLTSTLFGVIRQLNSIQELQNKPFKYDLYGSVYTENDRFGISFSEKGEVDLIIPSGKTNSF